MRCSAMPTICPRPRGRSCLWAAYQNTSKWMWSSASLRISIRPCTWLGLLSTALQPCRRPPHSVGLGHHSAL
jgi:hypothetical protein